MRSAICNLPQHPRIPPPHDFGHAGKVVLPFHGADAEAAVELVGGFAVHKADHAGDDVRGADVGNIEALHAAGRAAEGEFLAERGEVGDGVDGAGHAESVPLVAIVAGHGLGRLAEVVEHVAHLGGALEIEGGGGFLHLVFEVLQELL